MANHSFHFQKLILEVSVEHCVHLKDYKPVESKTVEDIIKMPVYKLYIPKDMRRGLQSVTKQKIKLLKLILFALI